MDQAYQGLGNSRAKLRASIPHISGAPVYVAPAGESLELRSAQVCESLVHRELELLLETLTPPDRAADAVLRGLLSVIVISLATSLRRENSN
jgi:hypothetical protein